MNLYAFHLGNHDLLSIQELKSLLQKDYKEKINDVVIFETDIFKDEKDIQSFQDKLGGCIKISKIFDKIPYQNSNTNPKELIFESLEKNIDNLLKNKNKKIILSFSKYGFTKDNSINSKETLNFLKKYIKKSLNLSSRWINKDRKNPQSSAIYKSKCIEKGIELNIIKGENHIFLSQGKAIQNLDMYTMRDFGKPARDAKIGMLPPKLAQILINLSGGEKAIFDPFCGTGTTLIEAHLMGLNSIGSDINPDMVKAAKTNIEWIKEKFPNGCSHQIFQKNATELKKKDLNFEISHIVTESFLGTAMSNYPSPKLIQKNHQQLLDLHHKWLEKAKNIISDDGKIVFCVPAYQKNGQFLSLKKVKELIQKLGFKIEFNYIYSRRNQIVAREIFLISKI